MTDRLWTKNFIIIALVNFLIYIVFYLLMVVIAPSMLWIRSTLPRASRGLFPASLSSES